MRVHGLTRAQIDNRVLVVESMARGALSRTVRSVAAAVGRQHVLAAGTTTDEQGTSPAPPSAPIGTPPIVDYQSVEAAWVANVTTSLEPYVATTLGVAAGRLRTVVEDSLEITIPPITSDFTETYIAQSMNRVRYLSDEIWGRTRDQILEGYRLGESIEKIQDRILKVTEMTAAKAALVARNEVVSAANAGSLEQVRVAELTGTKEWLATEDERTRPTHRTADGQSVDVNAVFMVGGSPLRFPGDPEGPASETSGCRCTLVYDLEDNVSGVTAASSYQDETTGEITGAMIALLPDAETTQRILIPGGEPEDQLHLTLYYLGTAADTDPATQARITASVVERVQLQPAIEVSGFGAAMWNVQTDEPSVVMNVGGWGNTLEEVREAICEALDEVWTATRPAQHEPWIPHICLAYTDDESYVRQALDRLGPLRFDRVRVAWGGVNTDVPLYSSGSVVASTDTGVTVTQAVELDTQSPEVTGEPQSEALAIQSGAAWEGVLVVEGVETGDGRMFAPGSLTWGETPLSLRWVQSDVGEHQGAVVVARIDEVYRDAANPAIIRGRGVFDTEGQNGAEAYRLVQQQFLKGVSVDVDSVKDADVEFVYPEGGDGAEVNEADEDLLMLFQEPEMMIFHAGRIRAATLVDIPAFVEAQIWLTDGTMDMAQSPPVSGAPAYSIEGMPHHGEKGDVDLALVAAGMGRVLSDASLGINMAQRRMAYEHLAGHLRSFGLTPQPFATESFSDDVKALVAGASTVADAVAPPAAWFTDPKFDGPTPLTVTQDGHVFGHGALWGSCHTGVADACVTPPHEDQHAYYRLGEIVTAEGEHIAVGQITMGTGHAPTFGITPQKAVEHYDNTGTVVADVVTGNDEYGIWFSGAIRPGLGEGRLRELRAAKLSGDWRRLGGSLRLVAFLAVNVPGFGVPRLRTSMAEGKQTSLVASGIVPDVDPHAGDKQAFSVIAESLRTRVHGTPQQRAAALRKRLGR